MEAGSRLGPYEIVEQLGAGGMGEVWLAQDSRLDRQVAVKVLPAEFASDPERLARFEQEAKAAAALNHPHIAVVHDVGHDDDVHYMVQERLEGESLGAKLESGPMPLRKALEIGAEVAAALAAAHRAGIVHRDLKPDNVFVSADGHAKVLDFGLAKLTEVVAPSPGASVSPTALGTMAGSVMGTAGYMAPEQIEGGEVDRRADLFALGCVLQEMVTGQRAFPGKSVLDTLHRIAHGEPETAERPGERLPRELQRILAKCLTRDRELRYQHADDVGVDLRRLAADLEAGRLEPVEAGEAARIGRTGVGPWGVVAIGLLAVAAGFLLRQWSLPVTPRPGVVNFALELPTGMRFRGFLSGAAVSFADAGDRVVYQVVDEGSEPRLFVQRLDDLEPDEIPDVAFDPVISPDGRWVVGSGMTRDSRSFETLIRVSLTDGSAETLVAELDSRPAAGWLGADQVVFTDGSALATVSVDGGVVEELPPLPDELADAVINHPVGLPGGRGILFTAFVGASFDDTGLFAGIGEFQVAVAVMDRSTGQTRLLLPGGQQGRYVEPGYLVFAQDRDLRAVRFDVDELRVVGEPVTVVRNAAGGVRATNYSVNLRGDLVYEAGQSVSEQRTLAWVDLEGREETLPLPPGAYGRPRVSSDGRYIAADDENNGDIWIWDLQRAVNVRLTADPAADHSPIWSPDGTQIYFWSERDPNGIYRKAASGIGDAKLVATSGTLLRPYRFLPDGTRLLGATSQNDIMMIELEGDPAVSPVLATGFATSRPELSPDGRWLAYRGNETGTFQIYVRPFPNVQDDRIAITADGGITPIWAPDGRTLYYMLGGDMFAVPVEPGDRFDAGRPQLLFSGPYENLGAGGRRFDIAPDGSRFLLVKDESVARGEATEIIVVLNWINELERLLPVR